METNLKGIQWSDPQVSSYGKINAPLTLQLSVADAV